MAYRLLDPLSRSRRFYLFGEEVTLFSNKPVSDAEWAARSKGPPDHTPLKTAPPEKNDFTGEPDELALDWGPDRAGAKDQANQSPPPDQRSEDPPERTPLKTAAPEKKSGSWVGPGATMDFAHDLVSSRHPKSGLGGMFGWDGDTSTSDKVLDTLDLIGIVDPTGLADATAAIGHLASGDIGAAAISAAGIVPFLGDIGKVGKWGARGAKTVKRARMVGKEARLASKEAKIAGKGAMAGGKAAAKPSMFARGKELYGKGKDLYGRAKEAHGRVQARKASRDQGAATPQSGQQPTQQPGDAPKTGGGFRDRLNAFRQSVGTAAQKVKGRFTRGRKADTTADLGRRPTGALSAGPTTPSLAPPGREAKQRAAPRKAVAGAGQSRASAWDAYKRSMPADLGGDPSKQTNRGGDPILDRLASMQRKLPGDAKPQDTPTSSGRSSGKGNIKQVTVGADSPCPPPQNKSSVFGAPPGKKRCHDQTPGRKH